MFGKMICAERGTSTTRSALPVRGAWKVSNGHIGSGLLRAGTSRAPGTTSPGRSIFALMKAYAVPVRVGNECHPADARFDGRNKHFYLTTSAFADGRVNVGNRQRDRCRSLPVPFPAFARSIQTEGERRSREFRPKIVPFLATLKAEQLLVERARAPHVACAVHYEIHGPDGDRWLLL